jgi:hypothetical protein
VLVYRQQFVFRGRFSFLGLFGGKLDEIEIETKHGKHESHDGCRPIALH